MLQFIGPISFFYLGRDSGEVLRVGDPVVVLERVHRLQDGGDAPHVRVDLRVRQELRGQVRVELHLQDMIRVAIIDFKEEIPSMYLTCTTAGVCIQREGLKRQWSSSCLSRRSVLFEGQVTRYLVSFRKVCEKEKQAPIWARVSRNLSLQGDHGGRAPRLG